MDELRPEDLEGLVQELEGQSEEGEQPSPGVERLLQDLEPERPMELKVEAVRQLGELSSSNPQIVEALAAVSMWDTSPQLRKLAAASLLAPAHQAVIEQHPGLLPQHVKNLLREMEKGGLEEAIADQKWVQEGLAEVAPIRTDALLHALQHGSSARARARAAERLAQVDESNLEIVESLIAARDDDPFHAVRTAAAEALRAPVHEAVLQDDADLMRRAQQEAAPKDWKAEMLASPVKPERFRVEAEGDTLSLSWRDGALHKVLSAGLLLLLLLVFGYALFAGTYSGENVCVVALALLLPGYWVLVAFVNSTQITLSREEWIFLRGPFPFPNRRFYSGRIRIDPAAYREIRTVQVEEKRRSGSGSSSDIEGVIAEVLVGALLEQFMEPRITYSLYARTKDGSDKLLLAQLERHEAAYLRTTLQDRLDARGGPQAGEAVAEVTARPVDLEASAKESGALARSEISPSSDWRFWIDFAVAGFSGGLALSALGGFAAALAAGFIPVPILGGVIGGVVGGCVGAGIHKLGLRRYVSLTWRWVLVCCVVAAATWAIATAWSISTATVSPAADRYWLSFPVISRQVEAWVAAGVLAGAVGGALAGLMQVRMLRQHLPRVANWWLLVNTVGWAAGGTVFLPTFWACSMSLQWLIYLLGGGEPPYTLEVAFRSNAAICTPVCGLLLLVVPIWAWSQSIRRR